MLSCLCRVLIEYNKNQIDTNGHEKIIKNCGKQEYPTNSLPVQR